MKLWKIKFYHLRKRHDHEHTKIKLLTIIGKLSNTENQVLLAY